jgi:hypothetical protein
MPKFRQISTGTRTVNRASGEAFEQSPKLALVSLLLTSFVKDKFYESEVEQLDRLAGLVNSVDAKFAAKAAIYARHEFGMRSITHALMGEVVHAVKGETWTKNAVEKVVRRPDDMLEILGYYFTTYGKPIPNALKKGLAAAMNKFDEYQIAKYRGARSSVKMVDMVNLVHPKVKPELQETIRKLMKDELRSTQTWEAKLTEAGQTEEGEEKKAERKRDAWIDLVKTRKIGYFALLRNLRNILEQAPDILDDALEMLTDEKLIRRSLVMPFRFDTAMTEIQKLSCDGVRDTVMALSRALDISVSNVPKFDGKTLVVLDESGSMKGKPIQIGSLFAAILYKSNDALLMTFSSDARFRTLNPLDSTMSIANTLKTDAVMGGTNFHVIFDSITQKFDRIIILSDMQGWMQRTAVFQTSGPPTKAFAEYKSRSGADPHIYSFDLNGHGDMEFPERQVYCIAGFSEKILDVMKLLEQDRQALINEIEKVEL